MTNYYPGRIANEYTQKRIEEAVKALTAILGNKYDVWDVITDKSYRPVVSKLKNSHWQDQDAIRELKEKFYGEQNKREAEYFENKQLERLQAEQEIEDWNNRETDKNDISLFP